MFHVKQSYLLGLIYFFNVPRGTFPYLGVKHSTKKRRRTVASLDILFHFKLNVIYILFECKI